MGRGGWGLDGVWADDFHHQVRRALAGDSDGYYVDYSGTRRGHRDDHHAGLVLHRAALGSTGAARAAPTRGHPAARFVICLQNHDQVGNRALRRTAAITRSTSRPLRVGHVLLLLTLPQTPLLFMGQEWAASTPFLYFTDHHAELGRLVTEGRRREFERFAAFSESGRARADSRSAGARPRSRARRSSWDERRRRAARRHAAAASAPCWRSAGVDDPALQGAAAEARCAAQALDDDTLVLVRVVRVGDDWPSWCGCAERPGRPASWP